VREFEEASGQDLKEWSRSWVTKRSLPTVRAKFDRIGGKKFLALVFAQNDTINEGGTWLMNAKVLIGEDGRRRIESAVLTSKGSPFFGIDDNAEQTGNYFAFPNYQDYGYGIFLLDDKSRDYVLKNIQNEKDPFLRSMMWGSLWDSVREGELDPKEYVELVIRALSPGFSRPTARKSPPEGGTPSESDESTIATLLGRVSTAMNYYLQGPNIALANARAFATDDLQKRVEDVLIERIKNAPTAGQRITFYRAFLNIASSENARSVLKAMLNGGNLSGSEGALRPIAASTGTLPTGRVSASIPLRTKDKFDIVTKLLILGDAEAPKLIDDLIKTETSDEAKRYAYAAKAGIATAENKAKYWTDFTANKEIPESWIEAAFGPFNSVRHSQLTLPYLERALKELPNHKRNRKIFFVNGWLGSFIGGQRSEEALNIVNKFLADNPTLDKDLRLKILENVDLIERAVKIRAKYKNF
jgi:aminopeptidase N